MTQTNKTIWIDLDNSPHVPFFSPISKELTKRGYEVVITARDCFQVCGLADLFNIDYKRVGRHYGKQTALKAYGTILRSVQLIPAVMKKKPVLAVSHGSRSQLISSKILQIPSIFILDYEHAKKLPILNPTVGIVPDIIADKVNGIRPVFTYPGIKEDVYVIEFNPDPDLRSRLGISNDELLVTIRPPATEAHYHNPEAEQLFVEVVERIGRHPDSRMVVLPRNEVSQKGFIQKRWSEWCENGKLIIPEKVLNGLDLIWASDFVVSGGGTMNREAAALGVPVYSIFRGTIGAVDRNLSNTGRLTLIEKVDDVRKKIDIVKRNRTDQYDPGQKEALNVIVDVIQKKAEESAG